MLIGLLANEVVPPQVATVLHLDVLTRAADYHDMPDGGAVLHRLVDRGLERRRRAAPEAAVRRDDDFDAAVKDSGGQGIGGEPAEDNGVRRADPGTRQDGDDGLRNHRQVDGHAVAGRNPSSSRALAARLTSRVSSA